MHDKVRSGTRREIPAVNTVLDAVADTDLPRPLVVDIVRRELQVERAKKKVSAPDAIVERVRQRINSLRRSRLQPVINGTGIIIHTNLGRAPLAQDTAEALCGIAGSYANLEQDLASGARGSRAAYVEHALALLCQADAATVVNNCAAALVLITHYLIAKKRQVVISRGEMVQIGGGFRIAEILEAAGASLREVGATNKTTIDDYARAISARTPRSS